MKLLDIKRQRGDIALIHFVGIGGIGMSGLAEILHKSGYKVQGSDLSENYNTSRLQKLGVTVFFSHKGSNIERADYVVTSSAIKDDNPEVLEAKNLGIPIIKRAEMLAELMRFKTAIAISGTHGKTTTTTLVAAIFEQAGLRPTVINGGIINSKDTNAYLGQDEYVIAEADESDATFIHLPATIGVITNIDPEHLDFYGTFENLKNAFRTFINNLPFYGFAVACLDHKEVENLTKEIINRKIITYGIEQTAANYVAFNIRTSYKESVFDVKVNPFKNKQPGFVIKDVVIPVPGVHNVLNSLAAIAIAHELNFSTTSIIEGFSNFKGVKRRFTHVGNVNGAMVIDDYAHHPQEVIAVLKTAKIVASQKNSKIIAVFQPHRYSRLHSLLEEFATCFKDADIVYISDVYSAGEQNIYNVSNKTLLDLMLLKNSEVDARLLNSEEELEGIVENVVKENDIFIFLGAGTVTTWAANIYKKFSKIDS